MDLSTLELNPVLHSSSKASKPLESEPTAITSEGQEEDVFLKPKPRCRKFIFKPFKRLESGELVHDDSKEPVDVTIPEQLAASYGLYIWPCSPVLAWYIWLHQDQIKDKTVLELGSGTALPGLLCSKIGAKKVILSDDFWQPNTLKNCSEAIKVNALSEDIVEVVGLSWGQYQKSLLELPKLDYVIGSDLFFDPKVFEPLVTTLAFLLERNPDLQVLITVQERSSDWSIEHDLKKWSLKCDYIYPREFLSGTGIDESDLIGGHTIYILKISKDNGGAV